MLPLQRLHKYSSIVLFARLHSPKPSGSSIYSFAVNNVAHLMSDGKIMVSQCWPHISRSAQFTIGHSVISPALHASHCCPVRGWFAGKHVLTLHRHTPTQITLVDPWLLGCYWSVLIWLVCSLPVAPLTRCWMQCCLKRDWLVVFYMQYQWTLLLINTALTIKT